MLCIQGKDHLTFGGSTVPKYKRSQFSFKRIDTLTAEQTAGSLLQAGSQTIKVNSFQGKKFNPCDLSIKHRRLSCKNTS